MRLLLSAAHPLKDTLLATFARRTAAAAPPQPGSDAAHVRFDKVHMAYDTRVVFDSLSCTFPRGRISVILGGSGSGKSTILRLIGGLIHPQAGAVLVDGQDVTQLSEKDMYQVRRKLGMLFQGGALLDSETVFDNLALPLREQTRKNKEQIADEVHAALKAVGVTDVDTLLPGELSGGMLRRVASRGPSSASPSYCCATSRFPVWIPSPSAASKSCWWGSISNSASRCWWFRTMCHRPCASPITSCCCCPSAPLKARQPSCAKARTLKSPISSMKA